VTEITTSLLQRRTAARAIAPLVLMGVIFYFSAQPGIDQHAWWVIVLRKLGHVTGYAMLTALWAWALWEAVRRPLVWAVAISFLYACSDELHQSFVRGRDGTPRDVLIDAVGMAIAVLLIRMRRSRSFHGASIDATRGEARSSLARSP
jgi:VanZ family protein